MQAKLSEQVPRGEDSFRKGAYWEKGESSVQTYEQRLPQNFAVWLELVGNLVPSGRLIQLSQMPEGAEPHVAVSNAGQALSSALAGLGRAVLPELLVKDAIEDGRLEVLEGPEPGRRAYWLVAPLPQWRTRKVKNLVDFLKG